MKYMGSKNRHDKYILPIILEGRTKDQWYVEPFVGGFNMIDKVDGNRMGADTHYYLIELFKALQKGWAPPHNIDVDMYKDIRDNKENYNPALVGFVGFNCSYAGKWFGGFARGKTNKGTERNYTEEAYNNLMKQAPNIQGVVISNSSYLDLKIPDDSIVYCDPPYANTTKYSTKGFDHNEFWDWCTTMSKAGHTVYVSEYTAPSSWEVIWEKEVNNSLTQATGATKGTEKLFKYKGNK